MSKLLDIEALRAIKTYVDDKFLAKITSSGTVRAYVIEANGTQSTRSLSSNGTANTIVLLDANGRAQVASPSANNDIANKAYVDGRFTTLYGTAISASSTDATKLIGSDGKVPLSLLPDAILGQLVYGGTVNASTGVATLTNAAKAKLGTTSNTITLTNDTSAITGYSANEGIYYIVATAGTFASLDLNLGDWLLANGTAWTKVDNTDSVTGVKGQAEDSYRMGNVNIDPQNIGISITNTSGSEKIRVGASADGTLSKTLNVVTRDTEQTITAEKHFQFTTSTSTPVTTSTSIKGSLVRLMGPDTLSGPNLVMTHESITLFNGERLTSARSVAIVLNSVSNVPTPQIEYTSLSHSAAYTYTISFPEGNGTLALREDLSDYVTLATAQTISGAKTFTSPINLNNKVTLTGSDDGEGTNYIDISSANSNGLIARLNGSLFVSSNVSISGTLYPSYLGDTESVTKVGVRWQSATSPAVTFNSVPYGSSSKSTYGVYFPDTSSYTANKALLSEADIATSAEVNAVLYPTA